MLNLIFQFAIVSPAGKYYTGVETNNEKHPEMFMSSNKNQAYTYTKNGAEHAIKNMPFAANFTVEQVS